MKPCSLCQEIKELHCFTKKPGSPDGLSYICRDCKKEYDKRRYYGNIEAERQRVIEYNRRNREARRVYGRRRYEKNRDYFREKQGEYYALNKDKAKEYRKNNKLRCRAHVAKRRARVRLQSKSHFTQDDVLNLLRKQRNKCACCGASLKDGFEIDHIIPLSKGGDNSKRNIQLLTPACNRKKASRDPIEFMQADRGRLL